MSLTVNVQLAAKDAQIARREAELEDLVISGGQADLAQLVPTPKITQVAYGAARDKAARRNELLEQEVEQLAAKVRSVMPTSQPCKFTRVTVIAPNAAIYPSNTGYGILPTHSATRCSGITTHLSHGAQPPGGLIFRHAGGPRY
jgi:hypothetical protein